MNVTLSLSLCLESLIKKVDIVDRRFRSCLFSVGTITNIFKQRKAHNNIQYVEFEDT
jgi:hypothetical protein